MKTKMIAATLLTYIALHTSPLSANSLEQSVSGSSENENPVSAPVQGMTQVQTANDTAQLDEWFSSRAAWEQSGEEMSTEITFVESSILEEWVSGMEQWEQENQVSESEPAAFGNLFLESWITGFESWEQE